MAEERRSAEPGSDAAAGRSGSRAVAVYNALRLLLLAACLGVGYLLGIRGLWLIVGALLVSGVLSYFLLAKQRIAMGVAVESTVNRTRERLAERTAAEDAYVDATLAPPADQTTGQDQ